MHLEEDLYELLEHGQQARVVDGNSAHHHRQQRRDLGQRLVVLGERVHSVAEDGLHHIGLGLCTPRRGARVSESVRYILSDGGRRRGARAVGKECVEGARKEWEQVRLSCQAFKLIVNISTCLLRELASTMSSSATRCARACGAGAVQI